MVVIMVFGLVPCKLPMDHQDTRRSAVTHLAVFAILDVLLPVEEPVRDFVLARILHDGHHTLDLRNKNTAVNSQENVYPKKCAQIQTWKQSAQAVLTSSSVSSPALLLRSMSAFLRTT